MQPVDSLLKSSVRVRKLTSSYRKPVPHVLHPILQCCRAAARQKVGHAMPCRRTSVLPKLHAGPSHSKQRLFISGGSGQVVLVHTRAPVGVQLDPAVMQTAKAGTLLAQLVPLTKRQQLQSFTPVSCTPQCRAGQSKQFGCGKQGQAGGAMTC